MRDFVRTLIHRREAGIFAMLLLITALVGTMEPRFLTLETARIVALAIPLILIAAMGQMMAGVVVAIALGTGLGLVNGLLVVVFKLPSIIVTLGTLSLYRGLVFLVSDARQVDPQFIPRSLISLSQTSPVFGIPWLVIIALAVAVATYLFLDHTRLGRQIYALGSNPVAAPLRGIKVVRVTLLVFALSGALSGLAGVLYASRFGYVNPGITGVGFEFTVIAAVVVGGVSINGGVGTVLGTVLGEENSGEPRQR